MELWRIWRIWSNSPKFYPPKCTHLKLQMVDYQEKFTGQKRAWCPEYWSTYFHPVKKLDLLSGSLSKIVPSTAIAAVNVKVKKTLNEEEVKKSTSRASGTYSFFTSAQKYDKRAFEQITEINRGTWSMISSPLGLRSITTPMYLLGYQVLFLNEVLFR